MSRNSCSYLDCLDRLVDEYNYTYNLSIGRKPFLASYSVLAGQIETNHKAPKFKVGDRVRITKHKNICSKGYTKNWLRKIFVIDFDMKTNP